LKHPLLALERVCALTTDLAAVDSFVLREQHRPGESVESRPVMEFYETDELGGQTDNWCGPTLACLMAFCRTAGFARVEFLGSMEHSALVACYRRWSAPSANAVSGPELLEAVQESNKGINCDASRDDYVAVWFRSNAESLTLDDVRPQVDSYGVRPIHVSAAGEGLWQANFKLPPGLTPGWHDVMVRIGDSYPSNAKPIAVDMPVVADAIELTGIRDSQTWIDNQLDMRKSNAICLWVAGLPDNADRNNVRVYVDGRGLSVTFVEKAGGSARQLNVEVPKDIAPGMTKLGVAVGDRRTEAVDLLILASN
jgi:hypothetical protein